ncbi:MAG TPA: hypothetical protein VFO25_01355 [Candidatus Eremiobacteraceae bacterium]|nr:hypothetical protein [Candidatus Eremiobacteraceae bacterium]
MVIRAFFGEYAFDDSFIGYDTASDLASGQGFSFDPGERVLSTSAPLAVLVYAGLNVLTHVDVVTIAQIFAALACLLIGFGTYALVRTLAAPEGALAASLTLLCAPSILLLWSHETYLCVAMVVGALLLLRGGRAVGAAIVLGLATLMRPEALLVAPLAALGVFRTNGTNAGLKFVAVALAPFAVWCIVATAYFGSPFSQSIAAKRAELSYNIVGPYLHGLVALAGQAYGLGGGAGSWLAPLLLVACIAAAVAAWAGSWIDGAPWYVGAWALAYTALYAFMRVPFFLWFTVQLAVLAAVCASLGWPRDSDGGPARRSWVGVARVASLCIVAVNVWFMISATTKPVRMLSLGATVVMPLLSDSAYRELGEWLGAHTGPADTIAYPEIGQLRYYSGRPIVDYEGLTNAGVAPHLALGDGIWAFKQYRPTVYVDNAAWHAFVDPLEYDWFDRAYRLSDSPPITRFPYAVRFDVYRLAQPDAIPLPDGLDIAARVMPPGIDRKHDFRIEFTPSRNDLDQIELRVVAPRGCARGYLSLLETSGAGLAARPLRIEASERPQRISLTFPPLRDSAGRSYFVDLDRCTSVDLAPPVELRHVAALDFGDPQASVGPPALALSVYEL